MKVQTGKYEDIAKSLDERLDDCFNPPILIFSDDRAKERFRLGVLKGNGMLFNAKYSSLEKFLSDLFVPAGGGGDGFAYGFRIINGDYLHYAIFKLLSDDGYRVCPAIGNYFRKDSSFDSAKLDGFSAALADLFVRYEKWMDDEWSRQCESAPNAAEGDDDVQSCIRKIYADVTAMIERDGCHTMGRAFRLLKSGDNGGKAAGGGVRLDIAKPSCDGVFLIGFTQIPPLYRDILDYACERCGIEVFEEQPEPPENFRDKGAFAKSFDKLSPKVRLMSAPGVYKEVETLHSQICSLLDQGEATADDIVVFVTNSDEYYPAVRQIFGCGKPAVPFSIKAGGSYVSHCAAAMETLRDISLKGYFSRRDFLRLLDNKVISLSFGMNEEDTRDISNWIEKMNVYRDRLGVRDWRRAIDRLELAKLTDEPITMDGGDELSPYADIASEDSGRVARFVRMTECLIEFAEICHREKISCSGTGGDSGSSGAGALRRILHTLFSSADDIGKEASVRTRIFVALSDIAKIFGGGDIDSPFLMNSLLSSAKSQRMKYSNTDAGGVTFASLGGNSLFRCKRMFFLGMQLENFPEKRAAYSFDLLRGSAGGAEFCDEDLFRLQLLCLEKGGEAVVSFNNKDLKKDGDLYLSPAVVDCLGEKIRWEKKEGKEKIAFDIVGTLDRPDSPPNIASLWSPAAIRTLEALDEARRDANAAMRTPETPDEAKDGEDAVKESAVDSADKEPCRQEIEYGISQLKKYLEEPFVFFAEKTFTSDRYDMEKCEFEPVDFQYYDASKILRSRVKSILIKSKSADTVVAAAPAEAVKASDAATRDAAGGAVASEEAAKKDNAKAEDVKEEEIEAFRRELACEGIFVPDGKFAVSALEKKMEEANLIAGRFMQLGSIRKDVAEKLASKKSASRFCAEGFIEFDASRMKFGEMCNLALDRGGRSFRITGEKNWYVRDGQNLVVVDCDEENKNENRKFLSPYLTVLVLLAEEYASDKGSRDAKVSVNLSVVSGAGKELMRSGQGENKGKTVFSATAFIYRVFDMTPKEAHDTLLEICEQVCKGEIFCMPVNLAEKYEEVKGLADLKEKLFGEHGAWQYFSRRDLFDVYKDIGYIAVNFEEEWKKRGEKIRRLIKFMKQKESASKGE